MKSDLEMGGQLLLFSLSGFRCAVPLKFVARIIPAVAILPLPGAPEIVEGAINFSGKIVPVVNLRKRLFLEEKRAELSDRIVMAHAGERLIGICADSVEGVEECGTITASESIFPGLELVSGVAKIDGKLAIIQDMEKCFMPGEEEALDAAMEGA